jgi:hypothetical protein
MVAVTLQATIKTVKKSPKNRKTKINKQGIFENILLPNWKYVSKEHQ